MHKTAYPNYNTSYGYMTSKIQYSYIQEAIISKLLPENAHRIPEIISLSASNSSLKPIFFWQLFSVLGQKRIVSIVSKFYELVYKDEAWFRSVFADVGDTSHHIRTQSAMWLDVMGGGFNYHGAEFRLTFHHQHNAFEIMNEKGAQRWIELMVRALDNSENNMTTDPRVRLSINTFLTYFVQKYARDFGFQTKTIFGNTNQAFRQKINFRNMTEDAIEVMSENELREGLLGRGVNLDDYIDKRDLIRIAKNL